MTNSDTPRRQLVNKIFGDSLPDTTSDERDDERTADEADRERWLRDNVPPHHS